MRDTREISAEKFAANSERRENHNGQSYCGKCGKIIPEGHGVQDEKFPNIKYHRYNEMVEMHEALQSF